MKSYVVLASLLSSAYGHGLIAAVTGANGVTTKGFGVSTNIPRNGTAEQPFQLDTPVLKNMVDDPCGATLQGGSINIQDGFTQALKEGSGSLPSIAADGSVTMTIHQVNADGGGPYVAEVNTDGTGQTWQTITVTQQVPGANGLLRGGPVDSQLVAVVPQGTKCTGGDSGNACLVRINNGGAGLEDSFANGAGPFGGCVAVINNDGSTGAAGNSTKGAAASNNNANANAAGAGRGRFRGNQRRTVSHRTDELRALMAKRQELDEEIELKRRELVERQLLTVDLIDELKTTTGTAIDIPIDAFAGQIDSAANGGNSSTAPDAILTKQQAVDLKKAVQNAIANVLIAMSQAQNISVDATGFTVANKLTAEKIAQANDAAAKALLDGTTTSINAGNAGVGEPNTALINSLLGGVSTVSVPAATATAANPAATAATNRGGNGNARNGGGRGRFRNAVFNKRQFRSRVARHLFDDSG
ncbi:hypothetical protein D9758_007808 [Tetrapyrgos nigripes]|uniref:Uncharacterized protein n=1 Tax=Tetrapyrgos nigripes TaxID=182062 RepID=A0A8H5FV46_9AGAR|nr:hypothetical protein D9758_007808 [Tetrapyrgos nigripes]